MHHVNSAIRAGLATVALLVAIGCEKQPVSQTASTRPVEATASASEAREDLGAFLRDEEPGQETGAAAAEMPAGHPPLDALKRKMLHYEAPAGWKAEPPAGSMRKAQFILPGPEGDTKNAELVISYLGPGQGSPASMFVEHYRAMFVDDDGNPVGDDAVKTETLDVNGLPITVLDVTGNYQASMMPGVAPTAPQKDAQRMLVGIAETADGPWFIKAVGPAETIATHRDAFMAFLRSVTY